MDNALDMRHFATLQQHINERLESLGLCTAQRQYQWLYGALGAVPSDVMFICENPSQAGVKKAELAARRGDRQPDIEDQWRGGGPGDPATRIFRAVLYEIGLKRTPPDDPGGWQCYITNVIKEMAVAGDFEKTEKYSKAVAWADILEWEIQQVGPSWVFCVGSTAHSLVRRLQRGGRLASLHGRHIRKLWHYSARRGTAVGKEKIREGIRESGFRIGRG